MATLKISQDAAVAGLQIATVTLSGNVTSDTAPVVRQVLVYKNRDTALYSSTTSDSGGNWSVAVVGNANDRFRVIIVGEPGENSAIVEDVVPA